MNKRPYNRFSEFLSNLKLKQKLLLVSFLLIIVPIAFCTFVSYMEVSGVLKSKTIISAKQVFEDVSSILDRKAESVVNTMNILSLDPNLKDILTRSMEEYSVPRQVEDSTRIIDFFSNFQKNNDLHRIRLYVREGLIYSEENVNIFSIEEIRNSPWYNDLKHSRSATMWCPPSSISDLVAKEKKVVSAVRRVFNPNSYGDEIGVLRIDILESGVREIIKRAKITNTGVVFIQDSHGALISYSDQKIEKEWEFYKGWVSELRGSNWETIKIKDQKAIIAYRNIQNTDWTLVSIIPLREVLSSSVKLTNKMLLITLIIVVLTYGLVYYLSDFYTKKIKQLVGRMKRVQNGDLDVIISGYARDEVGELVENFNYMINRMTLLIEEQYKAGQQVKNAELRALQAQINPHFLYNSFDAVNCMAIKHNVPEIKFMVDALAKFYKLSLNKGRDIIPLADEIEHVKVYVQIQNIRFEGLIKLEIHVDERIYDCKILKLILQPLVENAIIHGIFEKKDKQGTIEITGILRDDTVLLRVRDDGVGMPEEKIRSIFAQADEEQVHSYGVKNVNERIKLCFGSKYGLSYQSFAGIGTTAEISLPVIRDNTPI